MMTLPVHNWEYPSPENFITSWSRVNSWRLMSIIAWFALLALVSQSPGCSRDGDPATAGAFIGNSDQITKN